MLGWNWRLLSDIRNPITWSREPAKHESTACPKAPWHSDAQLLEMACKHFEAATAAFLRLVYKPR